jgi:chromate reductase
MRAVSAERPGGTRLMRVLGISGSLRGGSYNTELLRAAAELLPPPVEIELFDGLKAVPPYDEDDDIGGGPDGARELRRAIEDADAILIATPEYNSSVPGQLKNALDWASRPFPANALQGKPVAVVGASTGMFGAVWSQAEVRKVLGSIGACPSRTRARPSPRTVGSPSPSCASGTPRSSMNSPPSPSSSASPRASPPDGGPYRPRWRRASNMITAAATEAFSEPTLPPSGIEINSSQDSATRGRSPDPSEPRTSTARPDQSTFV